MLSVWFYDPAKDRQGLLNKVVAYMDAPFCHCELQFMNGVACSIYLGTTMVMKRRDFDPFYYTKVDVPCSIQQEKLAIERSEQLKLKQERCTMLAMSSCIHRLNVRPRDTFCSKLVADILQYAGLLENVCVNTVSPSALYRKLVDQHDSRRVQSASKRQQNMALDFKCGMQEVEPFLKLRI